MLPETGETKRRNLLKQDISPDDAAAVIVLLEVRIREEEEDLGELPLIEEVGKVLHRVVPQHGDVQCRRSCAVDTFSMLEDLIAYVFHYLLPNLHAQNEGVGEQGGQGDC